MENEETNMQPEEAVAQPEGAEASAATTVETVPTPYHGFAGKVDKFFGISKAKSTFRIEVIGGLTTFMAMVYILMVNAGMFSNPFDTGFNALNISYGAIYIATALSAIIGTVLMAVVAKLPMAQATGMGLNAFFVYTICVTQGLSYANALVLILIEGIVFIILTVTGLRKTLFKAIPKAVRIAIPAGIGLFIAFIGMQNVHLIKFKESTCVTLASFNVLPEKYGGSATYGSIIPLIITVLAVVAMAVLSKRGFKGAILWAILGSAVLYYILMAIGYAADDELCISMFNSITMDNPGTAFKEWGNESVGQVFANGFNFDAYLAGHTKGQLVLVIITSAFAFCMVDMFDTMGTLYGAAARGNMLTEQGEVPNMNKAMLCDAIATTTGAICGTSTVTTFVESSSGIGAGARTGFSSLVCAGAFLVAMFLSPLAKLIPTASTAAALIYVGVLMMNCVREIEWTKPEIAVPAFLTITMMPFSYNISYGIAFGIISYVLIALCTGKFKRVENEDGTVVEEGVHPVTIVIALLFVAMFLLTN